MAGNDEDGAMSDGEVFRWQRRRIYSAKNRRVRGKCVAGWEGIRGSTAEHRAGQDAENKCAMEMEGATWTASGWEAEWEDKEGGAELE